MGLSRGCELAFGSPCSTFEESPLSRPVSPLKQVQGLDFINLCKSLHCLDELTRVNQSHNLYFYARVPGLNEIRHTNIL